MSVRESFLPAGWYPRNPEEIASFLADFKALQGSAAAAVAPHAGWFFSGRVAAVAVSSLDRGAETVAVLGGHLPAGMPPLFVLEDGVRTPLGIMEIDGELRDELHRSLPGREDRDHDNTVEVLLPMVRFFFPQARLLSLRLPADISSFEAGKSIKAAALMLNRKLAVLGSADLTHYGRNYGFSPRGGGSEALRWVREVNDRNFIKAVEAGDPAAVLERAEQDRSCCSPGAVLGAMGFARASGDLPARLLEYATSADAIPEEPLPQSFVGYGAFAFCPA